MADIDSKNKDTVDGFDFEGMDWGNDDGSDTASSSSSPKSAANQDNPFEAADDDDGFGGGDSFYAMEQMPDTDNQSSSFSDLGDDFGDIKTDDEPVSYDFGSDADDLPAGRVITDEGSDFDTAEDPFASPASYAETPDDDEGAVDPFAMPDGDEAANEYEDAAPAAEEKQKSKFTTYLMAAAAAVIAVAGVAYVVPSFIGGAPQEVAEVQPVQDEPVAFPDTLPGQGLPAQPAPEVAQITPPAVVPLQPVAETAPPALTLPDLAPADAAVKPIVGTPSVVADLPTIPVKEDPFKDLVGGKERGGIDAMKDTVPAVADAKPAVSSDEVEALTRRLAALEGKVDRLTDSFDNYVEANVKAAPVVQVPTAAAAKPVSTVDASGNFVPPMKPPIIEGVTLKGVAGDVAWLSGKAGVFEVKIGDSVPAGGSVTAFRQYRGDWIVVTTSGIIVRQ